jgi:methylated-DNA-protein-cysteine methyltransferase-like protein
MDFTQAIIKYINTIPKGRVVSYGQVASACGRPRNARQVGRMLAQMDITKIKIPWWRVVNAQGQISIKGNWIINKQTQMDLLINEGVEVKDFKVAKKYFYSV